MEQAEPFGDREGREAPEASAASEAREAVRRRMSEAEETLRAADQVVRDVVAEKPLLAVGGALLAGYMIGRLFSRS